MFRKKATITDWKNIANFKHAILMLNKTEGKESRKKKKRIFYVKASSFRNVRDKTATKSSRVIVRDHSGQCPVQYLSNIRPAMKQCDWLILVIGPLN